MLGQMLLYILFANAAVAFCFAFFFQLVLILRLFGDSRQGYGIGDENSFMANLMRVVNGELYPDLGRRWMRSVVWVALSFLLLFAVAVTLDP